MTARMSANCSSVDFGFIGGGGTWQAGSGGSQRRRAMVVVGVGGRMRSTSGGKFGSGYQDVVAWAIRAKSKVTPSQLGQDQLLLTFIH
jgi:hypothetical protein